MCPHTLHMYSTSFQLSQLEDVPPFRAATCRLQGWALWEESQGKAQGKAKDDTKHGDLLARGQFQY